jgi:hypothetical protein
VLELTDAEWIEIEDGISIQFEGAQYTAGDYSPIAARIATGRGLAARRHGPKTVGHEIDVRHSCEAFCRRDERDDSQRV